MKIAVALVGLAVSAVGSAAWAHHSFAMFDQTKIVAVSGTVKEFQWANPHIWIELAVVGDGGRQENWSIEGNSPNGLRRQGWARDSVKPGDKVAMTVHPLKDGGKGGSLVSLTVNGTKLTQ